MVYVVATGLPIPQFSHPFRKFGIPWIVLFWLGVDLVVTFGLVH